MLKLSNTACRSLMRVTFFVAISFTSHFLAATDTLLETPPPAWRRSSAASAVLSASSITTVSLSLPGQSKWQSGEVQTMDYPSLPGQLSAL
eukprot:IDg9537t1